MQIIHKIEAFLYTLFNDVKEGDTDSLISHLTDYYTYGPYKPKVSISEGWVKIEIDTPAIFSQDAEYRKAVDLCEKRRYAEAKPILTALIKKNPSISEYHRFLGQIHSDEGNQEEAINCLIDALRWDSKNNYALLMLGNIFSKFKNDVPTAMKYYDQALIVKPDDVITINNIGVNLWQQNKFEEAKKYFWKVIQINPNYPNTHYALSLIAEIENDNHSSFYSAIQAIKLNKNKDELLKNSIAQAFEVADRILKMPEGMKIVQNYLHKLEFEGGKEIDLIEDSEIKTAAKFELAENYSREKHAVRYDPAYPAHEHLIMHELVHLDFILQARKENINQLFVSDPEHKKRFISSLDSTIKKLQKLGLSEDAISNYCSGLFSGMNLQVFNTPVDLFIEDFINSEYSELRPFQFISLYTMIKEGIKAVTDKKIVEMSPKEVVSKSKTYNIVNALQFRSLFGIDMVKDFQAAPAEIKMAQAFYDEYLQYKDDRSPAEEYELVQHWAEDLKLDKYFELMDENEYRNKRTNIDNLLESIERDPFDLETKDPFREREMEKFQKSQKEMGINMAVTMFMVDALEYFKHMPKERIQKIASEIAMQGTQGYRPDKKDYKLNTVSGKTFSGYHILAWYYVSWMLTAPEMVPQLQLPYDQEYKLALTMYKPD